VLARSRFSAASSSSIGVVSASMPPSWRIAANVPPPVVAICCQIGVVSARSPHCTVLIAMPFLRARATLSANFTSS
jgi:hypothetical protein